MLCSNTLKRNELVSQGLFIFVKKTYAFVSIQYIVLLTNCSRPIHISQGQISFWVNQTQTKGVCGTEHTIWSQKERVSVYNEYSWNAMLTYIWISIVIIIQVMFSIHICILEQYVSSTQRNHPTASLTKTVLLLRNRVSIRSQEFLLMNKRLNEKAKHNLLSFVESFSSFQRFMYSVGTTIAPYKVWKVRKMWIIERLAVTGECWPFCQISYAHIGVHFIFWKINECSSS